jgi:hypothetical protein
MLEPERVWWTADEIAATRLIEMPTTKRGVNIIAERMGWRRLKTRARRRSGKGGGWEYHLSLFPMVTRNALIRAATPRPAPEPGPEQPDRDAAWVWWDGLPDTMRAVARTRLEVLDAVDALVRSGHPVNLAVHSVASMRKVGARTIYNWRNLVAGLRADDRLPYLAPRHRAARRKPRSEGVDPAFGALIKADWLRDAAPTLTSAYDRCVRLARARGIPVAPIHTVRRWLEREVSEATRVLARQGVDALKRMYPSQERDKTALAPLEVVNADFHRFDVFVRWPGAKGEAGEVARPQMILFQDVFSRRLLAWRVDRTRVRTSGPRTACAAR